jgi:hypothetical protein
MSNTDDYLEPDPTLELEPDPELEFNPTDPEALADIDPDLETIVHQDPDEEVTASGELPLDPTRLGELG